MTALFKNRPVAAYYPMWREDQNWKNPEQSRLANINQSVNIVILSFIDPAKRYCGYLDVPISDYFFEGEGKALVAGACLKDLKASIRICKQNCPGRKILVSAGGEIGGEFLNADFTSMALLVADLGLDGLDLDYEPAGGMTQTDAQIAIYKEIITGARTALDLQTAKDNKQYLLSCAPTGVGMLSEEQQQPALIEKIKTRLAAFIPENEQAQGLSVGTILDDPCDAKSTALSTYNFESAGKMTDVFFALTDNENYPYIGNMVDMVIYQAYNMGSANLLGRLLCYESHRIVADHLSNDTGKPSFAILHGSHIGQEAFPRYAHTLNRLSVIYGYICEYGRAQDGASFWSYGQNASDDHDYVPDHGMGYENSEQVFEAIASLHYKYATVAA